MYMYNITKVLDKKTMEENHSQDVKSRMSRDIIDIVTLWDNRLAFICLGEPSILTSIVESYTTNKNKTIITITTENSIYTLTKKERDVSNDN